MIMTEVEKKRVAEFDKICVENYFIDSVRTCKDCGRNFEIPLGEASFFWNTGLFLPKRCPTCRTNRAQKDKSSLNVAQHAKL